MRQTVQRRDVRIIQVLMNVTIIEILQAFLVMMGQNQVFVLQVVIVPHFPPSDYGIVLVEAVVPMEVVMMVVELELKRENVLVTMIVVQETQTRADPVVLIPVTHVQEHLLQHVLHPTGVIVDPDGPYLMLMEQLPQAIVHHIDLRPVQIFERINVVR